MELNDGQPGKNIGVNIILSIYFVAGNWSGREDGLRFLDSETAGAVDPLFHSLCPGPVGYVYFSLVPDPSCARRRE
jgi:hypothetical protein